MSIDEHWTSLMCDLFVQAGVSASDINTAFIEDVYNHYDKHMAYHNHIHIYETLQLGVYLLSRNEMALVGLSPLERSTFCIALLCHDIDHCGYTNTELEKEPIHLESDYYSDDDSDSIVSSSSSYNEHHHISIAQKLLKKHKVSYDKSLLNRLIIFTDLTLQRSFLEINSEYSTIREKKIENHAILILLTKLADTGHILRPWRQHLNNVVRLNNERKQPLSSNTLPKDTIWFNTHYVYPLIVKIKEFNIGLYMKLNKLYQRNVSQWHTISEYTKLVS